MAGCNQILSKNILLLATRKGLVAQSRIFLVKIRLQPVTACHLLITDYNRLSTYSNFWLQSKLIVAIINLL